MEWGSVLGAHTWTTAVYFILNHAANIPGGGEGEVVTVCVYPKNRALASVRASKCYQWTIGAHVQ